jgi:hypothetical protein
MHGQQSGEIIVRKAQDNEVDLNKLLPCTGILSDQPQRRQANVFEESDYSSNVIKASKGIHTMHTVPNVLRRLM